MFKWLRKPNWREHPEYKRIAEQCAAQCERLKPTLLYCPFCGSLPKFSYQITEPGANYDWTWGFSIWCSNRDCEASIESEVEPEWVVEKWNRRYTPQIETRYDATTSYT